MREARGSREQVDIILLHSYNRLGQTSGLSATCPQAMFESLRRLCDVCCFIYIYMFFLCVYFGLTFPYLEFGVQVL